MHEDERLLHSNSEVVLDSVAYHTQSMQEPPAADTLIMMSILSASSEEIRRRYSAHLLETRGSRKRGRQSESDEAKNLRRPGTSG